MIGELGDGPGRSVKGRDIRSFEALTSNDVISVRTFDGPCQTSRPEKWAFSTDRSTNLARHDRSGQPPDCKRREDDDRDFDARKELQVTKSVKGRQRITPACDERLEEHPE